MRRSSTLLTRLALALLAVQGFVAPLAAREADGVVQTAGGKSSAVAPLQRGVAVERGLTLERAPAVLAEGLVDCAPLAGRRYLLNCAWLI